MITVTPQALPTTEEEALRKWLLSGGYETAKKVIRAKLQERESVALREAIEGDKFPNKIDVANQYLREAQRYQAALDVLKELQEQQTPYTTARLT